MRCLQRFAVVGGLLLGLAVHPAAIAQAGFTATQTLALSAYGGITGNWTGLEGGRNIGITAGADLALPTHRRFRPVLELRGTYPIKGGQIDAQKELLGGLRIERDYGRRYHPYLDFLAGRGQLDYQNGGFTDGPLTYISSTTVVYSGGGGLDFDLSRHFALRGDFQIQHWDTPFPNGTVAVVVPVAVTASRPQPQFTVPVGGSAPQTIYPKMVTVGVVYRFDFNHHPKRPRY